jgi:hypothetical protein
MKKPLISGVQPGQAATPHLAADLVARTLDAQRRAKEFQPRLLVTLPDGSLAERRGVLEYDTVSFRSHE